MVEELYILKDGQRLALDLNTQSGITLNFKSNIFGDLSKISASYSYTFKLPMTANNRRVLDMADDVRHTSTMIRRRLQAEYTQNGIPLFKKVNLYVESVESAFNAVMTWGAVDGFQTLKDNDCSLNELPHEETIVRFGGANDSAVGTSDNSAAVLTPEYDCGLPYRMLERYLYSRDGSILRNSTYYYSYKFEDDRYVRGVSYGSPCPFPVVPVRHLIDTINSVFGTKFMLSKPFAYSGISDSYNRDDRYDILYRGVIPCIAKNLNYAQLEERSLEISYSGFRNDNVVGGNNDLTVLIRTAEGGDEILSALSFNVSKKSESTPFDIPSGNHFRVNPQLVNVGATLFGRMVVTFEELHENSGGRHSGSASRGDSSSTSDAPTLRIIQNRIGYIGQRPQGSVCELASFEGEYLGKDASGYYLYEFDFREFEGLEEMEISDLTTDGIFFTFTEKVRSVSSTTIKFIPNYENVLAGQPMDVYQSLPDISCMTFLKSLFFMMGAYPVANAQGDIVPVFYDDLLNNIPYAIDWSKKVTTDDATMPNKVVFKAGDVAQRNHYLMKSDSLETKEDEEREKTDVYASGIGTIVCGNEVLDLDKTIITLPFSAPYILNKKAPRYNTGSTFKAWEYHSKEYKACTPNPIFGLIDKDKIVTITKDYYTGAELNRTEADHWTMRCWNGFADLISNPSFAYMQRIMSNPYVVTEYLNLNEFDLKDLDYSVPVYIAKFNAYFAIVSITRDNKGKCKCELLKLPQ